MPLKQFKIIPILGRKTDVPQDDPSLFQQIAQDGSIALTHDVGGVNFSLVRKNNACTKARGYVQWDGAANSEANRCMGLFELEAGKDRDHIYFDNGKCFVFNRVSSAQARTPVITEDVNSTTFATSEEKLYTAVRVGAYMVFTDFGDHQPYKWQHNEGYLTPLISSGSTYNFRYIFPFQRRLIGIYVTNESNGDISVRWSSAWPSTAITSLTFSASNQLYVPNDDLITGGGTLGHDLAYIYCRDSIQQLLYRPDYAVPFRMVTIVPDQGCVGHQSIVRLGSLHALFNRNYGFCLYNGDRNFPMEGGILSADIEADIKNITQDYYDRICGTFLPFTNDIVWAVPMDGASYNTHLFFYNLKTKQWRIHDKSMRCLDSWRIRRGLTWTDFETTYCTEAGETGIWTDSEDDGTRWPDFDGCALEEYLVYANEDGHLYYHGGDALPGAAVLDGYRIEPIMDFGEKERRDLLEEIWFDLGVVGNYNLHVYHRSGDTAGEVIAAGWTELTDAAKYGVFSLNSPTNPVLRCGESARLHQIKWGTNTDNEKFQVNGIIFKYTEQGYY